MWIPSHTDIIGNERADKLAKKAIISADAAQSQVYTLSDIKLIVKTKFSIFGKTNGKHPEPS